MSSVSRREQLLCAACHHPVIGFKTHEHCAAQRLEFGCLSNSIVALQSGSADTALRCRMGCGHFVPNSIQICDCCTYGLLDNSAKADFLATFAPESFAAHASAILTDAPRFGTTITLISHLLNTSNTPTDRVV